ncbi:NUDIX hydrolase [Streptomyces sp. AV19]|uniref:NUDIX hydrolase n=1 Tax=Streptomyces sp. AV19 TaxID=2793068 RepID=UPI0018FE0EE1|nr:NUDIX hydrolase [Streptomyces sp. AV19]MBH1936900.1 NUDIX hydrolase [Streptomyces sp. AV19]MDG4532941.1 NUDIX hydrolase [Streptomyces sp. AV19]
MTERVPRPEFEASLPHATAWAATLIRDHLGRVLLLHKTGASPRSWHLPGGHLDHGEHPMQAALRELGEEAGIAPGHHPLRLIGMDFSLPVHGWTGNRIAYFFDGGRLEVEYMDACVELSEEHDDWGLRAMTEWETMMKPPDSQRIHLLVKAAANGTVAYLHEMGEPA